MTFDDCLLRGSYAGGYKQADSSEMKFVRAPNYSSSKPTELRPHVWVYAGQMKAPPAAPPPRRATLPASISNNVLGCRA